MRPAVQAMLCVTMAVALASCGGGSGSGSGSGSAPSPTAQSLTITPGTTILKVNQTETFAGTVAMSNGQTQTVQPAWQSDNTTVLTFDNGGVARGRSNGTATIIGTNQGLTAVRLIRVATDYQGLWIGDYVVRRCEQSGDFRQTEFCDREDGFYVGEILPIAMDLGQAGDAVNGDLALGGIEGTTRGRVEENGRYVGTGSATFTSEGIAVVFALDPLSVNADGDRMTGAFTVTVTIAGVSGQGVLQADLKTVVRTASGLLPLGGHAGSVGSIQDVLRMMRLKR